MILDAKPRSQCTSAWRESILSHPGKYVADIHSAPTEDQVGRAKQLAEDLLVVLRVEYGKAQAALGGGGYQGGYNQAQQYGQQAQGQDAYAAYYQVSHGLVLERA